MGKHSFQRTLTIFGVLFLVGLSLVLLNSCTNQVTQQIVDKLPQNTKGNYEKTIHEFVIFEYFTKYDFSHFIDTFRANKQYFLDDNQVNYEKLTAFIIENFYLFSDYELYEEIINQARIKYQVPETNVMENIFSENVKQQYLDYKHEYGGRNRLLFNKQAKYEEMYAYYQTNLAPKLSPPERNSFETLLMLTYNSDSFFPIISFLEESLKTMGYSNAYDEFLKFALNNSKFYNEEEVSLRRGIFDSPIGSLISISHQLVLLLQSSFADEQQWCLTFTDNIMYCRDCPLSNLSQHEP